MALSYYVIAVGGTGNKILESVVYGACVDAFYTLEGKRRAPLPRVDALVVDVDASCGNTTRARQAAEYYESVRACFGDLPIPRRGFHTRLVSERWSMNMSRRAASVAGLTQNHKDERLLARALFTRTEAELDYGEGFRGHPDLGVMFFADLLNHLDDGQPDEMTALLDRMQSELDNGETVRVILCGSIFGGTGASGIPTISRYLRQRFDDDNFVLGAVLMLPYYKVPAASQNEELEIVVKSSTFLDKARTALQYYGMEGMIRSGEDDREGVYDALYLLGLPEEAFVTTRLYSTGSQSQENDAHLLEWLASRCVARFFRTGFRGEDARNIDCYYYQMHARDFAWECFDDEAELYREGYGGMLKAAAMFFAECYPTLRARLREDARGRANVVNYYAAFFYGVRRYSAQQRLRLAKNLDGLYRLLACYGNWMVQVLRSLPPTFRKERCVESLTQEAVDVYARLCDVRAIRAQRADEAGNDALSQADRISMGDAEDEERRLTERLRALLSQIGGSAYLGVLRDERESQRDRLDAQRLAIAELDDELERLAGEDAHLTDERTLRQESARRSAMDKVARRMALRLDQIGADVERAVGENVLYAAPVAEADALNELPENDLFDASLLTALHGLLTQYGMREESRDRRAMDKLADELLSGMTRLIAQRVPDRVGVSRIAAGMGGARSWGTSPDAALASFLAALLGASLEEDNA